jgi:hypothetical protein
MSLFKNAAVLSFLAGFGITATTMLVTIATV